MGDHLPEVRRKLALLRELKAPAEIDRRWDDAVDAEDDDGFAGYEAPRLDDGAEPERDWPGGLGDWFRLCASANFGRVSMRSENTVAPQSAVDSLGEPIDDRSWLRIGDVGHEDAILMDAESGEVIVYFDRYFKYRWASPVVLRRPDVPAFIDTVALGTGHRELLGPAGDEPWWATDPWYAYLREIGLVPGEHPDPL